METAVGKLLLKGVCSASNYNMRAINSISISFAYFLSLYDVLAKKNKCWHANGFVHSHKRGEFERLIFFGLIFFLNRRICFRQT